MKTIRNSVFETNSSSMHSISLTGKRVIKIPNYALDFECGEFGWKEESFAGSQSKLSYVLTAIQYYTEQPEYVVKPDNISWADWEKHPDSIKYEKDCIDAVLNSKYLQWVKEILEDAGVLYYPKTLNISGDKYNRFGYIDHQSTDTLDEIWSSDEKEFKENIKEFIFNPNWVLFTDNDNH